ncbi:MAG: tetratricopeptide repeat protein [Deltaproteobacteria bacterium]|nr:tetratricopeptide repeat protein [Deltaproteobacteria bacterium]
MMRKVALVTFLGALVFVFGAAFGFDPARDLKAAGLLSRAGDLDQAMRLARRALFFGNATEQIQALGLLAGAAEKSGRLDRAESYARRLLTLDAGNPRGHLLMGEFRMRSGDPAGALAFLDLGLELAGGESRNRPKSMAPHLARRGLALFELGRVEEAGRDADMAMALDPRDPAPHFLVGRLFEAEGLYLEALEEWELGVALLKDRDRYFFLNSEGEGVIEQLILLRMKAKVDKNRPLYPGMG